MALVSWSVFTAAEREAWHAAARAAGYRQTARWVRATIAARLAAGASNRAASKSLVPVEVLAELGRIGGNVNQLAHRANAAALKGESSPVVVEELEAVRRELSAVREALNGNRDALAQGEREAIEERVRTEVLAEVEANRGRLLAEMAERGRQRKAAQATVKPGDSGRYAKLLARLDQGDEPRSRRSPVARR